MIVSIEQSRHCGQVCATIGGGLRRGRSGTVYLTPVEPAYLYARFTVVLVARGAPRTSVGARRRLRALDYQRGRSHHLRAPFVGQGVNALPYNVFDVATRQLLRAYHYFLTVQRLRSIQRALGEFQFGFRTICGGSVGGGDGGGGGGGGGGSSRRVGGTRMRIIFVYG